MVKIFKHSDPNARDVYLLNPPDYTRGIRLSDGYWGPYHLIRNGEEVVNLTIDNSKFKVTKTIHGRNHEIKLLAPKSKCDIPHFILSSVNGKRLITKEKVYVNLDHLRIIWDNNGLVLRELNTFIEENYKKAKTIKLKFD